VNNYQQHKNNLSNITQKHIKTQPSELPNTDISKVTERSEEVSSEMSIFHIKLIPVEDEET
jgi:hypothetical protein